MVTAKKPEFGWMHGSYINSNATNGFNWNGKQPVGFMAYYNETQIIVGHMHNTGVSDMNTWSSIGPGHIKMCLITESGTTVSGSAGNFYYGSGTLADYMDGTVEKYKACYDARNNQADGTYKFTAGADFNLGNYFDTYSVVGDPLIRARTLPEQGSGNSSNASYSHEILGNLIPGATFSDGDNAEILLLDYTEFKDQSFRKIKLVRTLNVDNHGTSTGNNTEINLAEMEVWMDVAGTPTNVVQTTDYGTWTASQSTTHTLSGWDFSASQFTDNDRGDPADSGGAASFASTANNETYPWVMIETTQDITLEDVYAVMMFNRPNYQKRFYGLTVQFLDSSDNIVGSLEANQDIQVNGTGINHLKLAYNTTPIQDIEDQCLYMEDSIVGSDAANTFRRENDGIFVSIYYQPTVDTFPPPWEETQNPQMRGYWSYSSSELPPNVDNGGLSWPSLIFDMDRNDDPNKGPNGNEMTMILKCVYNSWVDGANTSFINIGHDPLTIPASGTSHNDICFSVGKSNSNYPNALQVFTRSHSTSNNKQLNLYNHVVKDNVPLNQSIYLVWRSRNNPSTSSWGFYIYSVDNSGNIVLNDSEEHDAILLVKDNYKVHMNKNNTTV